MKYLCRLSDRKWNLNTFLKNVYLIFKGQKPAILSMFHVVAHQFVSKNFQ